MVVWHSKHKQRRGRRQNGSVLLSTLFIVIAVTTISMGYLYRADMTLASGWNLELRNQADYLAWSGLEHARALIQGDPNTPDPNTVWPIVSACPDLSSRFRYELNIQAPTVTATKRTYPVTCEAYYQVGTEKKARSCLSAKVVYLIADGKTTFNSINRQ